MTRKNMNTYAKSELANHFTEWSIYLKISECAEAAGAVFIVSGDKHLLKLGTFRKTRVLSPREFFKYLTQN